MPQSNFNFNREVLDAVFSRMAPQLTAQQATAALRDAHFNMNTSRVNVQAILNISHAMMNEHYHFSRGMYMMIENPNRTPHFSRGNQMPSLNNFVQGTINRVSGNAQPQAQNRANNTQSRHQARTNTNTRPANRNNLTGLSLSASDRSLDNVFGVGKQMNAYEQAYNRARRAHRTRYFEQDYTRSHPIYMDQNLIKLLQPFVSEGNLKAMIAQIPNPRQFKAFNIAGIARGLRTLAYLNDTGADFQLQLDPKGNYLGMDAVLADTHNSIRIFDPKSNYVGTINSKSAHGRLFFPPHHNVTEQDRRALIDYATGNATDTYIYPLPLGINRRTHRPNPASSRKDEVRLIPGHQPAIFRPNDSRQFHNLALSRSDLMKDINDNYGGAQGYIDTKVREATNLYSQEVLGPDMAGISKQATADQHELYRYMAANGLSTDDLKVTRQYADGMLDRILNGNDNAKLPKMNKAQIGLYEEANKLATAQVGSYQDGFDPNLVINTISGVSRNPNNELLVALKADGYDADKFKGGDRATRKIKDQLVTFDTKGPHLTLNSKATTPQDKFKQSVLKDVTKYLVHAGITDGTHESIDPKTGRVIGGRPKVMMDENGVIRWQGYRHTRRSYKDNATGQYKIDQQRTLGDRHVIGGEIGQVFAPDHNGVVNTKFGSHMDFSIIPSYEGFYQYKGIDPRKGHGLNRMQRLRVRGDRQMLDSRIHEALSSQLLRSITSGDLTSARDDTIMDGMYTSELVGTRLPAHYFDNTSLTKEQQAARIATLRNRVSFPDRYGEMTQDAARTGNNAVLMLTDGQQMSNLPADYKGYFDLDLTSGGKQQGSILYLDQGTSISVAPDGTYKVNKVPHDVWLKQAKAAVKEGKVDKVEDYVPESPIGHLPEFKYERFNSWDRKQSSKKYAKGEALSFAKHARTAYMSFGGDTFEDSMVVSKKFAENHKVPDRDEHGNIQYLDADGNVTLTPTGKMKMRSLRSGDKLSDFGYNKATIAQIVDPDMSMTDAKKAGLAKEVAVFKANPDLDTVMSPYSLITRGNAGIAREMMADNGKHIKPVMMPKLDKDGNVMKGKDGKPEMVEIAQSGPVNFMITNLTSDKQTVIYDKENIRSGKARKLSSQMTWGLDAQHYVDPTTGKTKSIGTHILHHVFGSNIRSIADLREYLLAAGYDMDRAGRPNVGYHPEFHPDEKRQTFDAKAPHGTSDAQIKRMGANFKKALGNQSGVLKVPFDITMESGAKIKAGQPIPIMSSHLRRNMQLGNGTGKLNDVNRWYVDAYNKALDYSKNKDALATLKKGSAKAYKGLALYINYIRNNHVSRQQRDKVHNEAIAYSGIGAKVFNEGLRAINDLNIDKSKANTDLQQIGRKAVFQELGGPNGTSTYNKHSLLRDKIMAKKVGHSATAVAQNDTRLPLDTIAVSPHLYHTLFPGSKGHEQAAGSKNMPNTMSADPKYKNTYIMLHRDPVIHSGSMRGFKVVEDKNMGNGFKMNPINANSFEGDFDGDTYGVINVSSRDKGVQSDLKHMSVPYQLVDHTMEDPTHPIFKDGQPVYEKDSKGHKVQKVERDAKGNPLHYTAKIKGANGKTKYLHGSSELDVGMDMISGALKAGIVQPQVTDGNHELLRAAGYNVKNVIKKNPSNQSPKAQLQAMLVKDANEKVYIKDAKGKSTTTVDGAATIKKRLADTSKLVNDSMRNNFGAARMNVKTPTQLKRSLQQIVDVQQAKGNDKALDKFMDHFHGKTSLKEDIEMQNALSAKAFMTAAAGTNPQKLMSAFGDLDPNNALDISGPATQANLQVKHHKELVGSVRKLLTKSLPNLLNGHPADFNPKAKKTLNKPLTPQEWSKQYQDAFKTVGITLNPHKINSVANLMRDPGDQLHVTSLAKIKSLEGNPLYNAAYSGTVHTKYNHQPDNPGGAGQFKKVAQHNRDMDNIIKKHERFLKANPNANKQVIANQKKAIEKASQNKHSLFDGKAAQALAPKSVRQEDYIASHKAELKSKHAKLKYDYEQYRDYGKGDAKFAKVHPSIAKMQDQLRHIDYDQAHPDAKVSVTKNGKATQISAKDDRENRQSKITKAVTDDRGAIEGDRKIANMYDGRVKTARSARKDITTKKAELRGYKMLLDRRNAVQKSVIRPVPDQMISHDVTNHDIEQADRLNTIAISKKLAAKQSQARTPTPGSGASSSVAKTAEDPFGGSYVPSSGSKAPSSSSAASSSTSKASVSSSASAKSVASSSAESSESSSTGSSVSSAKSSSASKAPKQTSAQKMSSMQAQMNAMAKQMKAMHSKMSSMKNAPASSASSKSTKAVDPTKKPAAESSGSVKQSEPTSQADKSKQKTSQAESEKSHEVDTSKDGSNDDIFKKNLKKSSDKERSSEANQPSSEVSHDSESSTAKNADKSSGEQSNSSSSSSDFTSAQPSDDGPDL